MKWSIYNELIRGKGRLYLFNSLRRKYFSLNPDLEELIMEGFNNNIHIIENIHPELYANLLSEKFILPTEKDETSECMHMLIRKFSSKTNLRITINPTLDCNLRCWYCYESHIKGSCMNSNTIDAITKYVEHQVNCNELENVHLSFFGGEPLLKYKKVVFPLVKKCNEICIANNKRFALSITTNGVCLSPIVVDELSNLNITFGIQVAFDGNREIHNSIKCFPNGKGGYDITKKHLEYAIKKGITTTIRCNYTTSNIESFRDLIKDFELYWKCPNVRFSFHKVWQEPESEDLHQKRALLKTDITKWGINSNIESFYGDSIHPCYADYNNHVVINYNGDVYRCTARDFKPEHRLGCLDDSGHIKFGDEEDKRRKNRFTKQCPTCRLLPICTVCFQQRSESPNGNCPKPIMRENATVNIQKYFYDIIKTKGL